MQLLVQPGSSQNIFVGIYIDRLKVKVSAKAADGKANEATCQLIAKYFDVPKTAVKIIRGLASREKTVEIRGNPVILKGAAEKLVLS